jgi:prepilin-type N-terminal cleavage/methylation domain-containing protein
MKTIQGNVESFTKHSGTKPLSRTANGFTLIELMIAITMFLVIGAAAMSLFKQHASLFNDQQYQIGLNVSLRNALTQMEGDIVNAGSGWYNATNNVSSWPIGATIQNQIAGGAACHPPNTSIYNASCFDTLNIIVPDPNTPPGQVYVSTGTGCGNTVLTTTGTMSISPVAPTTQSQLLSGTSTGGGFQAGAQVVFVHVTTSGTQMTLGTIKTAAAGTGTTVDLTYTPTDVNGVASVDKFNLTTSVDPLIDPSPITDLFCGGQDWVVRIIPVTYSVDTATDPTNPTLTRKPDLGVAVPLASQVIGFKVGATTVALDTTSGIATGSSAAYCYDNNSKAAPCYNNQYSKIRSVRISLIGRTPPKMFQNSTYLPEYTNSFDQQPYKIQALSIIVNPRNLSMND